jgi:predicted ATP-grasp superfamily ATP-dependent carboligase
MLGPVSIAPSIQAQILQMAETLTQHYQLRGLNSLDVIVSEGQVFCLELNPRLSASMDLYRPQPALMHLHLLGSQGEPAERMIQTDSADANCVDKSAPIRARKIMYAQQDMHLANLFQRKNNENSLPDWISDIPNTATIAQYHPICSISAEGDSAEQVMKLLEQRAQSLSEWLIKLQSSKN